MAWVLSRQIRLVRAEADAEFHMRFRGLVVMWDAMGCSVQRFPADGNERGYAWKGY